MKKAPLSTLGGTVLFARGQSDIHSPDRDTRPVANPIKDKYKIEVMNHE